MGEKVEEEKVEGEKNEEKVEEEEEEVHTYDSSSVLLSRQQEFPTS